MQQESRKLSPREQYYLALLMPTLQPHCGPGEPRVILKMAKKEGLNIQLIHQAAANVRPGIPRLEAMGLNDLP